METWDECVDGFTIDKIALFSLIVVLISGVLLLFIKAYDPYLGYTRVVINLNKMNIIFEFMIYFLYGLWCVISGFILFIGVYAHRNPWYDFYTGELDDKTIYSRNL